MGDMLTLIEKAEQVYEQEEAEAAAAKLLEGQFTLEDFLEQMQQIKKMGPLSGLVSMLPGVPKEVKDAEIDDREIARIEAIIRSMTPAERVDPDSIDGSRRNRIAQGSGTQPAQVSELLKQFREVSKMMKRMGGMGSKRMKKARKGRKGAKQSKGRVTPKGKAPLKLPSFEPDALPSLEDLQGGVGGLGDELPKLR
jgi:signal recognition particle subunit SRP54